MSLALHVVTPYYLDAGTGSMLIQMVVAGVAGAAVFFRMGWARITKPFRRHHADATVETSHQHEQAQQQPADD